jgi:hypothetical protein
MLVAAREPSSWNERPSASHVGNSQPIVDRDQVITVVLTDFRLEDREDRELGFTIDTKVIRLCQPENRSNKTQNNSVHLAAQLGLYCVVLSSFS